VIEKSVSLIIISSVLISCTKVAHHEISGVIDEETAAIILEKNFSKIEIDLNSPGGKAGPSIQIAEFLSDKDVTFNVKGVCSSACAQVLLPVGDVINFVEDPMIGFHNSLSLELHHYIQNGGEIDDCPIFQDLARREAQNLKQNDMNSEFWKEVGYRLKVQDFKLVKYSDDSCEGYDYNFEHLIWYPTGHQMRDMFGLKFSGSVCADDTNKCIARIDALSVARKPISVIVGNTVHLIK